MAKSLICTYPIKFDDEGIGVIKGLPSPGKILRICSVVNFWYVDIWITLLEDDNSDGREEDVKIYKIKSPQIVNFEDAIRLRYICTADSYHGNFYFFEDINRLYRGKAVR